jgi:hypothetical protein
MLAGVTAGYHDYEQDPRLINQLSTNPFAVVTNKGRLSLALSEPQQFTPGTNFSYAHTCVALLSYAAASARSERACESSFARCSGGSAPEIA